MSLQLLKIVRNVLVRLALAPWARSRSNDLLHLDSSPLTPLTPFLRSEVSNTDCELSRDELVELAFSSRFLRANLRRAGRVEVVRQAEKLDERDLR